MPTTICHSINVWHISLSYHLSVSTICVNNHPKPSGFAFCVARVACVALGHINLRFLGSRENFWPLRKTSQDYCRTGMAQERDIHLPCALQVWLFMAVGNPFGLRFSRGVRGHFSCKGAWRHSWQGAETGVALLVLAVVLRPDKSWLTPQNFAWQAKGSKFTSVAALCLAGVALGNIHLHFCVAGVALGCNSQLRALCPAKDIGALEKR